MELHKMITAIISSLANNLHKSLTVLGFNCPHSSVTKTKNILSLYMEY